MNLILIISIVLSSFAISFFLLGQIIGEIVGLYFKRLITISRELKLDCTQKDALNNLEIVKDKLDNLKTPIIIIENLLFITLTLTCILQWIEFDISNYILIFFGWITLKIFGGYQQWGDSALGRVYYYQFLLGTLLNIFLSMLSTLGIYKLFIFSLVNFSPALLPTGILLLICNVIIYLIYGNRIRKEIIAIALFGVSFTLLSYNNVNWESSYILIASISLLIILFITFIPYFVKRQKLLESKNIPS